MKIARYLLIIATGLLIFAPTSLAQTGKVHVAFLSTRGFAIDSGPGRLIEEITQHLEKKGFTNGVNLELKKREAEGHRDRLPGLVAELVAAKVDVIVTFGYPAAAAARDSYRDFQHGRSRENESGRQP